MKFSAMLADEKSALDGDWIGDLPGMANFRVRIRAMDCPAAIVYQNRLTRELGGKFRSRKGRDTPPEVTQYINAKTLANVCVIEWENLEIPFDAEGRVCFDPARIAKEEPRAFSPALLEELLLEDAPDGEIVTQPEPGASPQRIRTPDGKRPLYASRDFLSVLFIAADRVSAPAEEAALEKKPLKTGSRGSAAKSPPEPSAS